MAQTYKILIADNLDKEGVDILNKAGCFDVDFRAKTERKDLLDIIGQFHGLIIRSATKVDKEVVEKATQLKVVIRAGVGVDNIDIPACSQKGIVVMNAPAGNSISTAEQAIALMFATARFINQADATMKQNVWEKKKFQGTQLTGKTLGIIGLGRIGKEVVKRGKGLQMNILGYDPFIPPQNLEHLNIELVDVETILSRSDFVTVHTPLTETTRGLVNKSNLTKLKPGVRLINAARGGIYDEDALAEGLEKGLIGGVGLDVFTQEPPPENFPLRKFANCVMTPHLGASTDEAQIEVAKETAQGMADYFLRGVARNSLNFPTIDPDEMDVLSPWFTLCERLGSFAAQVMKSPAKNVTLHLQGKITDLNLTPLKIALSKGILTPAYGAEVNLVNAPVLAEERGVNIILKKDEKSKDEASVLNAVFSGDSEKLELRATVNFSGGTIISVNNLPLEFIPDGSMLYIKNKDVPKVVGELGNMLGDNKVNIASLQLSRDKKGGHALTIIHLDEEIPKKILEEISRKDYIIEVKSIRI